MLADVPSQVTDHMQIPCSADMDKQDSVKDVCISTSLLSVNPLSANPTKWINTLKQFVGCYRRIV